MRWFFKFKEQDFRYKSKNIWKNSMFNNNKKSTNNYKLTNLIINQKNLFNKCVDATFNIYLKPKTAYFWQRLYPTKAVGQTFLHLVEIPCLVFNTLRITFIVTKCTLAGVVWLSCQAGSLLGLCCQTTPITGLKHCLHTGPCVSVLY